MYAYLFVIQKGGLRQIFAGYLSPARQYMLHREAVRNDRTPESVKLGVGKERKRRSNGPGDRKIGVGEECKRRRTPGYAGHTAEGRVLVPIILLWAVFNFATVRARN